MRQKEAFNILKIETESVTFEQVKEQYKKMIFEFHPDRNPAGLEVSQVINEAFSFLKDLSFPLFNTEEKSASFFTDDLSAALAKIRNLVGLGIEVCGCWIWITGDTRTHRATLKDAGYKYAGRKKAWYFSPPTERGKRRRGQWSMDKIRNNYGSERVQPEQRCAVTA